MKRFLLVIALALGLLAASALPAIADEHGAKPSNWSHDADQGLHHDRGQPAQPVRRSTGNPEVPPALCPEHRYLRHSDRLRPTVSGAA